MIALAVLAELVERYSVGQALHDGIEKACVSSILHSECQPFFIEEEALPFHELVDGLVSLGLYFTLKIFLIFLSLLSFDL